MMTLEDEVLQSRFDLLAVIAPLSDATINRKGTIGAWSIKNVMAHLAAWDMWITAMLPERLATGEVPEAQRGSLADEDAWNAQQVAAHEHLTPAEQRDEWEQSRLALMRRLRELGDALLNSARPWPGWDGTLADYIREAICAHDAEHREALAAIDDTLGA